MATSKWVSTGLVLGVVAAWIIICSTGEPRLSAASADGSYYNPCCGFLTLRGGDLQGKNEDVPYVIERDKVGAYVLPKALVSVASKRLDIDRSAYPLKLRLDRERDPSSIEVMDRSNGPSYTFARRDVR